MKSRSTGIRTASTLAVILWLASPAAATAQGADPSGTAVGSKWALIDGLGYGGVGFGLGLLAAWDMDNSGPGSGFGPPDEAVVIVGLSTLAGLVGGGIIGHRARRAIEEGRPLGETHRLAVMGGGVVAGGVLEGR